MDSKGARSVWRELLAVALVGMAIVSTAAGGYLLRSSTSAIHERAADIAAQTGMLSQITQDVLTGSSSPSTWKVLEPEVTATAQRMSRSTDDSTVTSPTVIAHFQEALLQLDTALTRSSDGVPGALSSYATAARSLSTSLSAAQARLQAEAAREGATANILNVITDVIGSLLVVLGAWYVISARDRQRRERVEATTETLEQLKALVAHGSEAIVVIDSAGFVSWAGGPTAAIWGHSPAEMEGRLPDDVIPNGHVRLLEELGVVAPGSLPVSEVAREVLEHPASDVTRVLRMRMFALPRQDGQADLVLTAQDISIPYQTRQALIRSEALLKAVLHSAPSAISIVDLDGRYLEVNPAWEQATLVTQATAIGRSPDEILDPDLAAQIIGANQEALERGSTARHIYVRSGQEEQIFSSLRFMVRDEAGDPVAIASIVTDVTQQRLLRRQQRLLSAVVEESADAIFTLHGGRVQSLNTAAERMFGWKAANVVGRPLRDLLTTDSQVATLDALRSQLSKSGVLHSHRVEWVTAEGEPHVYAVSVTPLKDFESDHSVLSVIVRDITELERTTQALRYQAHHDPLTGLPNRFVLTDAVTQARNRAQSGEELLALALIDLDHFKLVNDSLGHPSGDEVLKVVADRVTSSGAPHLTVRLGGDEFAVLWTPGAGRSSIPAMADDLLAQISLPIRLEGQEDLVMSASIGLTAAACASADTITLLREADIAVYHAKRSGRGRSEIFAPALATDAEEEHLLRKDLRGALGRNELELRYQPIVSLATGQPVALEALMRWHHPVLGSVPPPRFIPLAEDTREIVRLGMWALRQALQDLVQLRERQPALAMAVNVSGYQLDHRLAPAVQRILRDLLLPPEALILEITESVLVDTPALRTTISELAELGVQLSIDDFGTGYSALSYLATLPIDKIKLDRSFIHGMSASHGHTALNASIIQLAHALDLEVVAEGVEQTSEAQLLTAQGCDYGQGYLWSAPASAAQVRDLLHGRWSTSREAG